MIDEKQEEILPESQSTNQSSEMITISWTRYRSEFDEISEIASGSFGTVYRARYKLDQIDYAIKKIWIPDLYGDLTPYIAEVRTFANLNHPNIVPYKTAWLEQSMDGDDEVHMEMDEECFGSIHNSEIFKIDADETNDFADSVSRKLVKMSVSTKGKHPYYHQSDEDKVLYEAANYLDSNNNICSSRSFEQGLQSRGILYIQMAFRPLTLRSWLDERNKYSDFNQFYKIFMKESISAHENVIESNCNINFKQTIAHGNVNVTLDECFGRNYNLVDVATDIFLKILNGLNYIHLHNIVHHDIKPSNIFIGCEKNGSLYVQLGDFGLACSTHAVHPAHGVPGTETYAAPEQQTEICHPKVFN